MEKEIIKYRIETARLKNWDYSNFGFYFITICTKNMKCFFGEIRNEKLIHTDAGKIIEKEWMKTAEIRKNITLDEFKVMPNHFHGIIIIDNEYITSNEKIINWKPNSLGTITNQFKGACTKKIRNDLGAQNFAWQSRYYDRIIRSEPELYNVRNYIKYNHLNWNEDEYYRK